MNDKAINYEIKIKVIFVNCQHTSTEVEKNNENNVILIFIRNPLKIKQYKKSCSVKLERCRQKRNNVCVRNGKLFVQTFMLQENAHFSGIVSKYFST